MTTDSLAQPRQSGASLAWKLTLILIPLLTAGILFYLRHLEVNASSRRGMAQYGSVSAFRLINQDGKPFGSDDLAGRIWIADFIYTTCPGPCPMISSRMSEMQKPLRETDVQFVSFSVDPDTDTPAVLREYAQHLKAMPGRWDFLTGDKTQLFRLIEKDFKLAASDHGGEKNAPLHSTRMVLVDRHSEIRGYYDATDADAVTRMLADTSHLLREQPR